MNILKWEGEWWFFFPLLPWGIAISIHYLSVFGFPINKILSADWEEKELQKEMKRLKNEGFQLLNEKPKKGADNKLVCFLHPKTTNGVLVELCQSI